MSLLTQASLILTPTAYKASTLYSIVPSSGNGDMTITRATTATRTNSSGIVETVASNVPRLDYTSGVGSILLEPQRTNLLLNSDNIPTANSSVSTYGLDSSILTPANTNNAYKFTPSVLGASLIGSAAPPENRLWIQISNANTTYTNSVYVKSVSGNSFNLAIKVANQASDTEKASTTINVNNNWQRVSVTGITDGTSAGERLVIRSEQAVYLWGFQAEQGAYATSYIPTVASTVTRNSDNITRSNIFTNGLITSAGGTWFIELNNNFSLTRDGAGTFSIGDALGNNLAIKSIGIARLAIVKNILNVQTSLYTTLTDTVKIAIKWNGTNADVYVNGIKVVPATAFTTTIMELISTSTADVPKYIKSMMLFPTPLTDAECASITTL